MAADNQTSDRPRTPADEIDWRASLATPEAKRAEIVSRSLFSGGVLSADEVSEYFGWLINVGFPAIEAAKAEAEARGVSIYGLR